MENKKKIDDAVMKALNAKVIRRLICITDKGNLDLVIRKGENNYFLSIDSVPLDKETNDKLMGILFKPEVVGVNVPIKLSPQDAEKILNNFNQGKENIVVPKKKGRPSKIK